MSKHDKNPVILGFDFGSKHIGVAIGNTLTQTASPLATLQAKDGIPNWSHIAELINTWKPGGLVVGLPTHLDGSEQSTTHAARKFGNRLHEKFQLPLYFVDERLTSVAAKIELKSQGRQAEYLAKKDSLAAKIILESWLEQI